MKKRLLILSLVLILALTACAQKTELRFSNETECGTATVTLTNVSTGHVSEYNIDQGKETTIDVKPDTEYHYEVTYPRQPDFITCETKRVTTMLSKGQTLNVKLESVLAPELEQATLEATPPTN